VGKFVKLRCYFYDSYWTSYHRLNAWQPVCLVGWVFRPHSAGAQRSISRSSPRDSAIKRSLGDLTEKWINYNDNGWTVGTAAQWLAGQMKDWQCDWSGSWRRHTRHGDRRSHYEFHAVWRLMGLVTSPTPSIRHATGRQALFNNANARSTAQTRKGRRIKWEKKWNRERK